MDSLDQASNDQLVLEGAPNEAGASLEEGIPIEGPSNVDEIREETSSGVDVALILLPRPVDTEPSRKRPLDRLLLSKYIPPQERVHPLTGMVALDLEGSLETIHRWSPFNQVESPVAHMRDLYPNYFQVPVAARVE